MKLFYSYPFWLIVVSAICIVLERIRPWRKTQGFFRPQVFQDYFWLLFNGVFSARLLSPLFVVLYAGLRNSLFLIPGLTSYKNVSISFLPLVAQVAIVLVVSDFIEWCVHNCLHRIPWLWKIHRVHHSIIVMDWIGNFRFHWGETILYSSVKYLPLFILGAQWQAVLIVAVAATFIGHLNHSNCYISWGPFRYILNSSRMHIWHHEKKYRGKAGVNFGIVFSVWDWLFGTAYMPRTGPEQPEDIGYKGLEKVSHSLVKRFFVPFID